MTHIVAARVQTQERAEETRAALQQIGVADADIEVFQMLDAGRHAQHPIGGDRDTSPGAEDSASGAAKGAVAGATLGAVAGVAAAAAAPLLAPAIIAGATGAGAFAGSLGGAMRETDKAPSGQTAAPDEPAARRGGLMIAVNVGSPERSAAVIDCLRAQGAEDVERADGQWRDGHWVDFDPLRAPERV